MDSPRCLPHTYESVLISLCHLNLICPTVMNVNEQLCQSLWIQLGFIQNHNYKQVSVNTCPICLFLLSFSLSSFHFALCWITPPLFCTSSYFTRYTTITAVLSLTPLCHSDTTWYHQDERYVSRHSDALIWLYPNWISLLALLSNTGSQNVASLIKVCSAWPLQNVWCDEQWTSDNCTPQIGTTNSHW